MTDHDATRCPACDAENVADATFCSRCGTPMGTGATTAPAQMDAASVGASASLGSKGYVVAAVAVGAVLLVGGALVLVAGGDDDGDALVSGSTPISALDVSTETSEPVAVPLPTEAVTTVPAATAPPTTAGTPSPTTTAPPTAPPTTAAPTTAAPTTAAPTTAPPTTAAPTTAAPVASTVAPTPSVTLSFEQAADFYRNYIATASSGDYNAAWNMLSSSDQADYANGFDQFVGFWRSVSFADVQRVESVGGSAGFQSLVVNMAYGQVDGDPTSLEVVEVDVNVRPDGSLQIFDYRYIRNQ